MCLTVLAGALSLGVLQADTVLINSDLINESNSYTGANVFIAPHPQWAIPPAGSAWISYDQTGVSSSSFAPGNNLTAPLVVFRETFSLPYQINAGFLRVWADDTAQVAFDGVYVGPPPNFTQNVCANGVIGCEQNEYATILLNGLRQGQHTLTFETFQIGGGPFGLLYSGQVDSVPEMGLVVTPEPQSVILMGTVLVGTIALLRRKRR
jgi:hypothetical protein